MKRTITTIIMASALSLWGQGYAVDSSEGSEVTERYGLSEMMKEADMPWSLDRCMEYAADNASSVRQARWDVATATATRDEAFASFFPSIQAQIGGQFSWGRNIDPETNTYNDVTTFNNGYGLFASLSLFDGGQTLNRYRQARNERARSLNAVAMARDDSAIAAMMAFTDVLYYQNSIGISEERLRQSEGMLRLTKAQEELGIKGMPDVAQAEATVASDRYALVHDRNLFSQAMLSLRSAMNFPSDLEFSIDTVVPVCPTESGREDMEEIYAYALSANPKALANRMSVESSRLGYEIAKGGMLPSLSLGAGISTSYYKTIGNEYRAPAFGDQFRNNRGEYISATLSIPIFSNLGNISAKKRARYSYRQALERKEEADRRLHDDIVAAVIDRDGLAMEIKSLEAKTEADHEAFRLNTRMYEEGLLSLIDLQLSANTYYSSRVELLRKRMLYVLKSRLVEYYKGNRLWM